MRECLALRAWDALGVTRVACSVPLSVSVHGCACVFWVGPRPALLVVCELSRHFSLKGRLPSQRVTQAETHMEGKGYQVEKTADRIWNFLVGCSFYCVGKTEQRSFFFISRRQAPLPNSITKNFFYWSLSKNASFELSQQTIGSGKLLSIYLPVVTMFPPQLLTVMMWLS